MPGPPKVIWTLSGSLPEERGVAGALPVWPIVFEPQPLKRESSATSATQGNQRTHLLPKHGCLFLSVALSTRMRQSIVFLLKRRFPRAICSHLTVQLGTRADRNILGARTLFVQTRFSTRSCASYGFVSPSQVSQRSATFHPN